MKRVILKGKRGRKEEAAATILKSLRDEGFSMEEILDVVSVMVDYCKVELDGGSRS